MADAGLRGELRKHLPEAQWTPVETGTTAQGVPDAEYCFPGGGDRGPLQGWVECKRSDGWAVKVRPGQVGWLSRRARLGGRCFLAVRRLGRDRDELWIFHGGAAGLVGSGGLRGAEPLLVEQGGPARWDWGRVRSVLCGGVARSP